MSPIRRRHPGRGNGSDIAIRARRDVAGVGCPDKSLDPGPASDRDVVAGRRRSIRVKRDGGREVTGETTSDRYLAEAAWGPIFLPEGSWGRSAAGPERYSYGEAVTGSLYVVRWARVSSSLFQRPGGRASPLIRRARRAAAARIQPTCAPVVLTPPSDAGRLLLARPSGERWSLPPTNCS